MSRYIDYDAIDYKHYKLHDASEEFLKGVVYMAQRINEAPSIDIVRCGECKHYVGEGKYCQLDRHCTADDFCSYGVKKGADDESIDFK